MTIEAVIADIDLAAREPLRVRRLPVEHPVPLAEPVQFGFGEPRPETFRIGGGFSAQLFQLRHGLDVCLRGEGSRRIKDPLFAQDGFDVGGG